MRYKGQGIAQIKETGFLFPLRDAIVVSATDEYMKYLKKVQKAEQHINEAISEKDYKKFRRWYTLWWSLDCSECLRFLRSAYFESLTDISAEYIIKRMRKEYPCGK